MTEILIGALLSILGGGLGTFGHLLVQRRLEKDDWNREVERRERDRRSSFEDEVRHHLVELGSILIRVNNFSVQGGGSKISEFAPGEPKAIELAEYVARLEHHSSILEMMLAETDAAVVVDMRKAAIGLITTVEVLGQIAAERETSFKDYGDKRDAYLAFNSARAAYLAFTRTWARGGNAAAEPTAA